MADENKPVSELYNVSRGQIQNYESSIGTRLVSLMNLQAFMLGIYASTSLYISPKPQLHVKAQMLNTSITYLGLIINLLALVDTCASVWHMHKLWKNYKLANHGKDSELNFPTLYGNLTDRTLQGIPPILNILLFIIIWTLIILYDHKLLHFS